MARQPKEVKIAGAFVTPGARAGWVRTGETKAVPSQIQAVLHLDEPPVVVRMFITVDSGARAEIREISIAPRERTTPVSNSLLRRVPVDYLMRAALERATVEGITVRPDIQQGAFQLPGDPEHQAWVSPIPPPEKGRGQQRSAQRIRQAAQVYREALAVGSQSPGMEVAKALGYSRATAARDIRLAREAGLLPADDANGSGLEPQGELDAAVSPDPIWQRFGDPGYWAPMEDVLNGPMGLPVAHPGIPGAEAPDPVPDATRRRSAEERLRQANAGASADAEPDGDE